MQVLNDLRLSRASAAAFAIVGVYWGAFAALAPALKAQSGLSDAAFGGALLVASIGALMAMWLAPMMRGWLATRAAPVLAFALVLAFLVPGLAQGWTAFALGMLLASMASGTLDVVMNADVSALEARSRRPLMNLNHATFSFAYALSAVSAGLLRQAGFQPIAALVLCGAASLGLIAIMTRQTTTPKPLTDSAPPTTHVPAAILVPAGLVILIAFLSEQATEGWSALHLERNHDANPALGALGPALLGLTMGVGRLSGQLVAQRASPILISQLGATLAAFGALIAALAPSAAIAIAGFAILGTGISVVVPMIFAHVGALVSEDQRVAAIARVSVIGYAGFFVGPPMMGFLAQGWGLPVSFATVALLLMSIPFLLAPRLGPRRT